MELFVNSEKHEVSEVPTDLTLLRYLRDQLGLKGTKEGCASGDCGACTVLVGDGSSAPVAVNSCIVLLGGMQGAHVYTVDGLATSTATSTEIQLHPAQKAMVDCHGSQCGFCTPGFVMSLAGLMAKTEEDSKSSASRQEILDAISGNLCRCTGYRPIVEAGVKMFELDHPEQDRAESNALLEPNQKQPGACYLLPQSESELQDQLKQYPDAQIVAGGTDKVLEITQNFAVPAKMIDVSRVSPLCDIAFEEDYLSIGSAATYTDIELKCADIMPEFLELLHRLGSRQIRNRGTLGGNIANASPIADTPPALMVLDTEIELVKPENKRQWLSLEDFYLDYKKTLLEPGDYLAAIRIPLASLKKPHLFYKISKRFEDDISAVMGAFCLEFDDQKIVQAKIAFGGIAATPVRAIETEKFLLDQAELLDSQLDQACQILADEFSPITDVRATSAYRSEMTANLLRRAVYELRDNQEIEPFAVPELGTGAPQTHA